MLSIILISTVVVAVVFAVVNKFTKKQEQPVEQPTVVEEPLGYETSSLAELEQPACLYPGVVKDDPGLIPVTPEEPLVFAKPAKKPKAKMSAKPKAPKKKKDA